MKRLFALALIVAGGALCSCGAGAQSSNPNVGPGIGDRHANAIFAQAEFALNCPRDQIRLTKVAQNRVGADGCGGRVLYVRVQNLGWVANTQAQ